MATQANRGQAALKEKKYEEAVTLLSEGLKTSQSPIWLLDRSTAYQRLHKYDLALADAESAFLIAQARARREHMATAQFRRAIAFHGMKRLGDARLCLNWCRKYNEKEKALGIWQAKVAADYEVAEKEGREEMIRTSVKEIPDKPEEVKEEKVAKTTVADTSKVAPSATLQTTPKEKIRHEWYQSGQTISITIFAKGVPKDKAEINIEEGSLEVSFPINATDSYDYTVSPLFAKIDPKTSSYRVTPHKIEITLHKAVPNLKWSTLEGSEPVSSTTTISEVKAADISERSVTPQVHTKTEKLPSYPTSSRTGPKNWDKLGEDADEDNEADGVDSFFKQLYAGADPDSRKAMMKSYQESNGTALSTDWSEVSKGTVKTQAPDGVEAKKWDQ